MMMTGPIWTMPSTNIARRQHAREGNSGERHADAADDRLQQRNADDAARDGPDRRAREIEEVLAVIGIDAARQRPHRREKRRSAREQKAGDDDGEQKHQRPRAGLARRPEQELADRLQLRQKRFQHVGDIVRRALPVIINLLAEERPILDALRRRRDRQAPLFDPRDEPRQALDQPDAKPGRRPDDDQQPQDGDQYRGHAGAAAERRRQPDVDGIERDGQHDAPHDDRQERVHQRIGRIKQEADKPEMKRHLDECGVEPAKTLWLAWIAWRLRSLRSSVARR